MNRLAAVFAFAVCCCASVRAQDSAQHAKDPHASSTEKSPSSIPAKGGEQSQSMWMRVCPEEDGKAAADTCAGVPEDKQAAAVVDAKGAVKLKKGTDAAYEAQARKMIMEEDFKAMQGEAEKTEALELAKDAHMLVMTKMKVKAKMATAQGPDHGRLAKADGDLKVKMKLTLRKIKAAKGAKALAPAKAALERESKDAEKGAANDAAH